MGICDSMDRWNSKDYGYGDRLQDVRDWVKSEADSWGFEKPSLVAQAVPDEEGQRHYASYDPDTNTINVDPELFNRPDLHPPEEVYNSIAHEMRHAMQHQFYGDEIDENMDKGEREQDAKDFADAYSDYWKDECGADDDADSVPGGNLGDFNLPPEGGAYA